MKYKKISLALIFKVRITQTLKSTLFILFKMKNQIFSIPLAPQRLSTSSTLQGNFALHPERRAPQLTTHSSQLTAHSSQLTAHSSQLTEKISPLIYSFFKA